MSYGFVPSVAFRDDPDKHDAEINMDSVDGLSPAMKALVHEFGLAIVAAMVNDGYDDPVALRTTLEGWRFRRQTQWLATDYVTGKSATAFSDALIRIRASRGFR